MKPVVLTPELRERLWLAQLRTVKQQIEYMLENAEHRFYSTDGVDYLQSALELADLITRDVQGLGEANLENLLNRPFNTLMR